MRKINFKYQRNLRKKISVITDVTMKKIIIPIIVALLTLRLNCEKTAKNTKGEDTKDLLKDEKLKGFLKLYNFALKHGKLNLTETLKNLTSLNETTTTKLVNTDNSTAPANETSKEASNSTVVKLPEKSSASLNKKPSKESTHAGSGDEKGETTHEDWDDSYEEDNGNGNNEYNNYNYQGGEGYEYTNNNGEQNGQGYQYELESPSEGGSPMMEGQSYDFKGGVSPDSFGYGGTPSFTGESNSNDFGGPLFNYDEAGGNQFMGNGEYDKKTKTHKYKKQKARPKHHKHLATKRKETAKKYVGVKKHALEEGKGYRRTIMIGNRVCGSKKSTDIHARDEIHAYHNGHETVDNMVKRGKRDEREKSMSVHATDACCNERAQCPRIVPAKATKYGYENDIEYDVMACHCDAKFRQCLKNANSYTADAVGHLFFNTLKIPCLTFEQPQVEAKSEQPIPPQDSQNVVSVVPDAYTDRETVGGAQLVISPKAVNHMLSADENGPTQQKDFAAEHESHEHESHEHESREHDSREHETHERERIKDQQQHVTFHVKDAKDDDDEVDDQQKTKQRPDTINPNPSPNNPNPYGTKLRGVVTLPEAYLPKASRLHQ